MLLLAYNLSERLIMISLAIIDIINVLFYVILILILNREYYLHLYSKIVFLTYWIFRPFHMRLRYHLQ